MEPTGIGAGWQKGHHCCSPIGFKGCICDPIPDFPSVGRVHPADVGSPILGEPVLFFCEKAGAFGVLWGRADIQREMVDLVKLVEKGLGRAPFGGVGTEVYVIIHELIITGNQLIYNKKKLWVESS